MSRSLVLCFGKVDAALEASKQLSNQVFALDDVPEEALTAPVLVIGASQDQVDSPGMYPQAASFGVMLLMR